MRVVCAILLESKKGKIVLKTIQTSLVIIASMMAGWCVNSACFEYYKQVEKAERISVQADPIDSIVGKHPSVSTEQCPVGWLNSYSRTVHSEGSNGGVLMIATIGDVTPMITIVRQEDCTQPRWSFMGSPKSLTLIVTVPVGETWRVEQSLNDGKKREVDAHTINVVLPSYMVRVELRLQGYNVDHMMDGMIPPNVMAEARRAAARRVEEKINLPTGSIKTESSRYIIPLIPGIVLMILAFVIPIPFDCFESDEEVEVGSPVPDGDFPPGK